LSVSGRAALRYATFPPNVAPLSAAIAALGREQIELEESLPKFVLGFAAVELYNRELVFGKLLENFEDGEKFFFVLLGEAC